MKKKSILITGILILFAVQIQAAYTKNQKLKQFVYYSSPRLFTYKEIVDISKDPASPKYSKRLQKLWRSPIISNRAYYNGVKPNKPYSELLQSDVLRCVSWNIEKSKKINDAILAFSSADDFTTLVDAKKAPEGSSLHETMVRQQKLLHEADIIILQEMEIGMKRSGYLNAAGELAKKMKMNYAYAPQYLEIDPVPLGLEKIYYEDKNEVDTEATQYYAVDPKKYKGLFGGAVLSRYPIKKVILKPLENQGYDWYEGEKKKFTFLEKTRRFGSKIFFHNVMTREIKTGYRSYFRVDLHVPHLPEQTLTVINVHLEIKCTPEAREKEIKEILSYIKEIKHPVILAGDFNASSYDISPTNLGRESLRAVTNPTNWLSFSMQYLTPYALAANTVRSASNFTKNFDNPLAPNVPIVAPNKLKPMFSDIKNFQFDDGSFFDFRGDQERSVNKGGTLSNSNQRDMKGFKTSFKVNRPILVIGKYRLDWFFVKSYWKQTPDTDEQYKFAPHFAETLSELNCNLIEPISDHSPNVITLPFNEPDIMK